jgi:[glutamine synthetase] adenylyltransferase / [glutamine synthetase]-adenylyl-L-tyrosine phosphorylase
MSRPRANPLSELAKYGFEELSNALQGLDRLVQLVGDVGHTAPSPLAASPSPDRSLQFLLRLAEQEPKLVSKVLKSEGASKRLLAVVGASDALADQLLKKPKQIELFFKPAGIPKGFQLPTTDRSAMRIEYRRLLLQIVDWDLQQPFVESFEPVTRALSDLATAALAAGLLIATEELISEGRITKLQAQEAKLAIIAMGKCGARELNYLSDVDVIYASNADGDSVATATKIAARLALVIDESDVEVGLWQVDPNLRPEGKDGALVRTVDSHIIYYQKWAHAWEFQALLKARFVAGDEEVGNDYISRVKPLIWERTNRSEIVESARNLRRRVLEHIPAAEQERQIKLGRGGLRDVEFTAQLLQLVHGVADESLRVMGTLESLQALADAGLIARVDREQFNAAYKTLRTMEHRTQLLKLRRTHLLPSEPGELRRIARSLNPAWDVDVLEGLWTKTRGEVATLHDIVFYRPLLAATAALTPGEVALSSDEISSRLTALGFKDTKGAIEHIRALSSGLSRRAIIQRTLLPVLIRFMAEGTAPDRALITFRRLSETLGESHWFLKMLRDSSGAAERLMATLSLSAFACRLLEHIPESSSWFGEKETLVPALASEIRSEMLSLVLRGQGKPEVVAGLKQIRRRETLRTSIASVLGLVDQEAVGESLSAVTDSYIAAMLAHCQLEAGTELDICVVAMGRLGGRELGFGSDADVMLVYRGESEQVQKPAELITASLIDKLRDPVLNFELDLDLRPEGKNGPRIKSLEAFDGYYRKWAETWEFQALTRARTITGSDELQDAFIELINPYRFPAEIGMKQLVDIRRIKARVENERLPQGADPGRHLKLGRGSISDVEWLVQLLQLRFASQQPKLQGGGTLETLEALRELGHIDDKDARQLSEAWNLASRIRSGIVLGQDRPSDSLPVERGQLEAVARVIGYSPGSALELEETYLATTRKARAVFERLFLV